MSDNTLFQTQRAKVLEMYKRARQPFHARTKPYKSTQQFVFTVVDPLPAAPNMTVAYAVLRAQQRVEWFSYKVGDAIPFGNGTTKTATEGDTNQSKARNTNGTDDFIIEGISASCKTRRIIYADADAVLSDADAEGAHEGSVALYDPGAIASVPQLCSPFNGEDVFFEALKTQCAIEFEWNRETVIKIGTLDEIPEGGAKSFLRASGDPRNDNRYRIPEGFLWRRSGEPDGDFIVRGTVTDPIVVPVSLVGLAGVATLRIPTHIFVDVTVRLHGLSCSLPSNN